MYAGYIPDQKFVRLGAIFIENGPSVDIARRALLSEFELSIWSNKRLYAP
jgi:hypothetical protein